MNKLQEREDIQNVITMQRELENKEITETAQITQKSEKFIKKLSNILFIIALVVISIVMCIFIGQKEGWHADEIFSFGSSNYKNYNIFLPYADGKTLDWRTSEEAREYVEIQNLLDAVNYVSVYRNQALDVHPPLFYFLVHTISIIFFGEFTKYSIFILQLAFMIGTCIIIKKIMQELGKENLVIPTVLLYGLSMGAISTVMFQRMYMMLTFFVVYYLYVNIKILKNNYNLDNSLKKELGFVTVFGFLTQYNFCVYALFVAIVMIANMLINKQKEDAKKYVIYHLKLALIGILIFPSAIYHIFFSYRGISGITIGTIENSSYFTALKEFVKMIFNGYSLNNKIIYIISLVAFAGIVYKYIKCVKNKESEESKKAKVLIELLIIPLILFVIVIAKMSPYIKSRYILCILPLIPIITCLGASNIIKKVIKNKIVTTVIVTILVIGISGYGLATKEPEYLYKGYNKYVEIAQMNRHTKFVYIVDNGFTHIKNIKEFMTYDKYLIINTAVQDLDILKDNKELEGEKEFILSIKKYMGVEPYLQKVMQYTGATSYEILLDDDTEDGSIVYRVTWGRG